MLELQRLLHRLTLNGKESSGSIGMKLALEGKRCGRIEGATTLFTFFQGCGMKA